MKQFGKINKSINIRKLEVLSDAAKKSPGRKHEKNETLLFQFYSCNMRKFYSKKPCGPFQGVSK